MFWRMTLSTLVAYPVAFFVVRLLGKKQISTLTFWDLVSAIALGSLAANIVVNPEEPLIVSAWVVVLWGILALGTGWLALKSRYMRGIVQGAPTLVIANGKILEEAMRRERLNIETLLAELRTQGVFTIDEVEFAVFEPSGKISVLKKSQNLPVTPSDLKLPTRYKGLSAALVMEGTVMSENLQRVGLDDAWLRQHLAAEGVANLDEVFYAELGTDGSLRIDRYDDPRIPEWQQH